MYPVCTGSAALQRRVSPRPNAPLMPLRSTTSTRHKRSFFPPLYAGLKARTTRMGGHTIPGTDLERNLWRSNILELPHLQKRHQERQG
jgi:hypothetical protein